MGSGLIPGSTDGPSGTLDIDAGTSALTESPDPSPIGLDAPSGSGSNTAPSAGLGVVGYARGHRGHHVGDGECSTLADRALASAGARGAANFGPVTPDADYVWGTQVTLDELQPGDIVQFRSYRYDREVSVDNPDGSGTNDASFEERPHHTAIVESINGNGGVTVLEQNAPQGSAVRRAQLFFRDSTVTAGHRTTTIRVQGTFWFFRPQPR
ncbi:MAG: hypothetical protein ABI603_16780 [Acidobacteriota bacterium]